MNFISNIIWDSVGGFVEAGTRTAGGYAGDALLKAGDMIEGAGRSVGTGIEKKASGYGSKITGGAPTPTSAKKPGLQRSISSPASSKAGSKPATRGPTSKTPLGANKYPGGKGVGVGAGTKAITSSAKSITGGAGSIKKPAPKTNALPKAYPNNVPYGTTTTPSSINAKPKSTTLPKAYPGTSTLPSANSSGKKTAVRSGAAPKPFTAPGGNTGGADKPYPGTNTLPGQASKTPVKKYKPMERMKAPVEHGKASFV